MLHIRQQGLLTEPSDTRTTKELMIIKDQDQLEGLKAAGSAVATALHAMKAATEPGISTAELDAIGTKVMKDLGVLPAPPTRGFPADTCISINDVAAHGIPSKDTIVRDGDLVNIDVSGRLGEFWADNGESFTVGEADPVAHALVSAVHEARVAGLTAARAKKPVWRIGSACERVARQRGFVIVRNLCGHGVGGDLWEPPQVPSYADRSANTRLREGQVLAIEPFLSETANYADDDEEDGWTLHTTGSRSVQVEHTIVVTKDEPIIVTVQPE